MKKIKKLVLLLLSFTILMAAFPVCASNAENGANKSKDAAAKNAETENKANGTARTLDEMT